MILSKVLPPLFKYTTFDPIIDRGDFWGSHFWQIMQEAPLDKPPYTHLPVYFGSLDQSF